MRYLIDRSRTQMLIIVGWLGLVACGLGALANYGATPGAVGEVPNVWPTDAAEGLTLAQGSLTIVLAVHPRCPCTRATINELERTLARAGEQPTIYALIFEPALEVDTDPDESFARTQIRTRLSDLPGVVMVRDPGSEIASRFGAMTSGHTLVYDADGSLRFSGGLTPTRAHEGPNTGSASLIELLNGGAAIADDAPVYGCPLCPDSPVTTCPPNEVAP